MAYAKRRQNGRYTAVVSLPNGDEQYAGTYDDEATAFDVAQAQERFIRDGSTGLDPHVRATMTIAEYAPIWLKNHRVEPSTKSNYQSIIDTHIIPHLGKIRVAELQREAIRTRISIMQDEGASPTKQKRFKTTLSAMMGTAVSDGYRSDNPCTGLKTERRPSRAQKKITVLTTDQFGTMLRKLPTKGAQALARLIIGTGCRPSEAFALTPDDIDVDRATVQFVKAVQVTKKEFGPNGATMFIADTKTHDQRTVKIDKRLLLLLLDWIAENEIGSEDLLFPRELVLSYSRGDRSVRRPRIELTEELLATLGEFEGPNGKMYKHGTMNGYVTGNCHCDYCKQGLADYRYDRTHAKNPKQKRRERSMITAGYPYMTRQSWLDMIRAACKAAEIPFMPTAYQLRHTHASWLIDAGEDPKTVMTRLGHASLDTTSIYVHMVDDGSSSADIMDSLSLDWDLDEE